MESGRVDSGKRKAATEGMDYGGNMFFFASRRRQTKSLLVSWGQRCVLETDI